VAPGTKVLLLSERDEKLHLDPVFWGYAPVWWGKPPLINARVETAATSRMFKPLWQHGRAICFADGWFEWKKEGDKKQPYFIHRADGQPIFMAAIGSTPFERGDKAEGFLIVTSERIKVWSTFTTVGHLFCHQKRHVSGCGKILAGKKLKR
jgi:putative SOS response-associated peptidase YedK